MVYRALLIVYRALFIVYRILLIHYGALLMDYRGFGQNICNDILQLVDGI